MRAAYLASFAVFGWTDIFREAFVPVRQRLGLGLPVDLPPAMIRYDTLLPVVGMRFAPWCRPGVSQLETAEPPVVGGPFPLTL